MTTVIADQISVRGVVRQFAGRRVLDNLDLTIARSEFVVLLGPSGCGKSTLLRLLAGLDLPDSGEVVVPKERAVVFQADRLLPWERVLKNVTIGLYGRDAKDKAKAALDEVGLGGRSNAWPKTLSGGEAQRVALARALVTEPDLVLLDEPFAALDALTRLKMHDLVRQLHQKHGAAMLLVTHDVAEAIALADRILVMQNGRIGSAYHVGLSAADRRSSPQREELRAQLLSDLGLTGR
ncbi:ABC transporter ATP-binding protein [Smaragdicoccus niigatensis]|uniref:ABC transporter ATP-binding protein n=1 Tax=Smaragdicoccus niigatensis TaxID=359359 RepID=UPI00035D76FE|nr:ABC transporter ATP-binding protein [Smaragdicoccus niigatensis]